jgi:hypothetical protein
MFYPIIIQFIHFIADFLCQSRKMANNKSKSVKWLSIHVFVYSLVTTIFWMVFTLNFYTLISIFFVTFLTHWCTDYCTSKLTTYFYGKNDLFAFFSVIGFDQFIHSTTLILTYNYYILT